MMGPPSSRRRGALLRLQPPALPSRRVGHRDRRALGYAFSAGHVGAPPERTDQHLGDFVGGQFPLWLDAGYRFNRELYLGGYFHTASAS